MTEKTPEEMADDAIKKFNKSVQKVILENIKDPIIVLQEDFLKIAEAQGIILKQNITNNHKKRSKNKNDVKNDDDDVNNTKPPKKKKEEEEEQEEQQEEFVCAGIVWETPNKPCVGGSKSNIKDGTQIIDENGKRKNVVICRGCKNVRNKQRRAEKKKTEK